MSSSLLEALYASESAEDIVLSGRYATIELWDKPVKEDIEKASMNRNQLRWL